MDVFSFHCHKSIKLKAVSWLEKGCKFCFINLKTPKSEWIFCLFLFYFIHLCPW